MSLDKKKISCLYVQIKINYKNEKKMSPKRLKIGWSLGFWREENDARKRTLSRVREEIEKVKKSFVEKRVFQMVN